MRFLMLLLSTIVVIYSSSALAAENVASCGWKPEKQINDGVCENIVEVPKSLADLVLPFPEVYKNADEIKLSVTTDKILEIVDIKKDVFVDNSGKQFPFFHTRGMVFKAVIEEMTKRITADLKNRGIEINGDITDQSFVSDPIRNEDQGSFRGEVSFKAMTKKGTAIYASFDLKVQAQTIKVHANYKGKYDNEGNVVPVPEPQVASVLRFVAIPETAVVRNENTQIVLSKVKPKFGYGLEFLIKL